MNNIYDQVEELQNLLIDHATGTPQDDEAFKDLRKLVLSQPILKEYIPEFIRKCRNLSRFWMFIKDKFGTYSDRRKYIYNEFAPMLDVLEYTSVHLSDQVVSVAIEQYDLQSIREFWSKALERRVSDPEGAITIARTLIESVCKHILEEAGIHEDNPDITKLYRLTAQRLKLGPSQHTEEVFKQILGGCTAVVEGLGALRNRLSDSHGKGKVAVRPKARHAELAVNLAGAMAIYLLATWEAQSESPS